MDLSSSIRGRDRAEVPTRTTNVEVPLLRRCATLDGDGCNWRFCDTNGRPVKVRSRSGTGHQLVSAHECTPSHVVGPAHCVHSKGRSRGDVFKLCANPFSHIDLRLVSRPSHFAASVSRQTAIRSRVAATGSRSAPIRSRITTMRSRIMATIDEWNSPLLVIWPLQTARNSPITRGGSSPTSDCYCREIRANAPGIRAETSNSLYTR